MEKKALEKVLSWVRTTDLAEVAYRRGGEAVELSLEDAEPSLEGAFPACRLVPVASPEVGVFRWAKPGKARAIEPGAAVSKGQVLGLVQTGAADKEVAAPESGRLVKELVDDGTPVEYGQPLFFIQP